MVKVTSSAAMAKIAPEVQPLRREEAVLGIYFLRDFAWFCSILYHSKVGRYLHLFSI